MQIQDLCRGLDGLAHCSQLTSDMSGLSMPRESLLRDVGVGCGNHRHIHRRRIDCGGAGLKRCHLGTGLAEAAVHKPSKERGTPQS